VAVSGEDPAGLRLDGRTVVVTGAARGIGRSEAETLAARGAAVLCVDVHDPADVVASIQDSGGHAQAWVGDITNHGAAEDVVAAASRFEVPVTGLVNNAGRVADRMTFNLSDEEWADVLDTNLTATFRLCRALVRQWRAEGGRRDRRIINTTSESGLYGNVGQSNYAAAKAGVAAVTLTMAAEVARLGITVNAIAPRARTPMSENAFGDLSALGERLAPHFVANVVAWLISSSGGDITGQVFVVAGAEVQLLQTWSAMTVAQQPDQWTDDALRTFRDAIFRDVPPPRIASPISDLFGPP
jgi:3-oxoacyl-[acyl-carrier protein] reductase